MFVTFSHKLSCYSCKAVVDHGVYTWFNQKNKIIQLSENVIPKLLHFNLKIKILKKIHDKYIGFE